MAAYKKDINLFKAAGGERAKSKKMAASRKLVIVAILVVILVAGAIGGLVYYKMTVTKQLNKLVTQAENYRLTATSTRSLLEELHTVEAQSKTALLIEYKSMMQPGFSTDLSADELTTIRNFLSLETTGFTVDNRFDDVVDDILASLNLVQYNDDSVTFSDDVYDAQFLHGALSYMKSLQPVFINLPQQAISEEDSGGYWYCYYRGKMVMLLRSTGGDAAALAQQMQTPTDLGCSPFCSLEPGAASTLDNGFATYATVNLGDADNTSYVVMAITCKSVVERFLDSVEQIFAQQSGAVQYRYSISDYAFQSDSATFSVKFEMEQSVDFRLKDVCDAVAASPFFNSKSNYAYEVSDSPGPIERILEFEVVNNAVTAITDASYAYFRLSESDEEEGGEE